MAASAGQQLVAGRIPGERIATQVITTDSATFTTTNTVILSVTAPVVEGRTYRVRATPGIASTVDEDVAGVAIREDSVAGTLLLQSYVSIDGSGSTTRGFVPGGFEVQWTASTTENKTFVVEAVRVSGSGTLNMEANASEPRYLYVDYITG